MGHSRLGVIMERIGGEQELRILQIHAIVEYGLPCVGMILAPVAGQHIFLVDQFSTFYKPSHVVEPVVDQTVGIQL